MVDTSRMRPIPGFSQGFSYGPLAKPSERSGVVFGYADDDPAVYHDMFHASTTLSSRFEKVAFAYDTSARMAGVAYSGFKGGSS